MEGFSIIAAIAPTTIIVAWLKVFDVNPEFLGLIWVTLLFAISGIFLFLSAREKT